MANDRYRVRSRWREPFRPALGGTANANLANRKPASANTRVSCIAHLSEIADLAIVMFGGESHEH